MPYTVGEPQNVGRRSCILASLMDLMELFVVDHRLDCSLNAFVQSAVMVGYPILVGRAI